MTNVLAGSIVLLILVSIILLPRVISGMTRHASHVRALVSLNHNSDEIRAEVHLINAGDRPAFVLSIWGEFIDLRGFPHQYLFLENRELHAFTIQPGEALIKSTVIYRCPQMVHDAVTHVGVMNFDGSVEDVCIASNDTLICGFR